MTKNLDALALKQQVQERIYEEIKGMSIAEQLAYFQRTAEMGELGTWWQKVKRAQEASRTPVVRHGR